MDVVTAEVRSRMMAGIRGKNTNPEKVVRSIIHRMGLRFRLHQKDLPGSPDLVLRRHNTVVFVHGCFWHLHGCRWSSMPKTRTEFWRAKLNGNRERDKVNRAALRKAGWRVIEIWECELRDRERLTAKLAKQFGTAVVHL